MNNPMPAQNDNVQSLNPQKNAAITSIFEAQREYFLQGSTLNIETRKNTLRNFLQVLKDNEGVIYGAIYDDFKKSRFEVYETELAMIYHDIKTFIKNLDKWSKAKRVSTNLANMPASSKIVPEPLGNSLIIGAWNFPYQLSLVPAVAALAAGNTVILKPSELSPRTSAVMAQLINQNFAKELFYVQEGAVEETTQLLELPFDKIFYTGSTQVGKIVMRAAAEHLSSVTLELGGKSPCFIFADTKLELAAQRLVWGKFLNSGQTCVAPDYVMIEESIKDKFLKLVVEQIKALYGDKPENSEGLVRIISARHLDRLVGLIPADKVYYGGGSDKETLFLEPTILDNVELTDKIMQEEIFGPILPFITFTDKRKAFDWVRRQPKPLAAYLFGNDKATQEEFINTMPFGGATINDALVHVTNNKLPFGGIGASGVGGGYHGEAGFKVFSHYKAVMQRGVMLPEMPFKYPPYTDLKFKVLNLTLE